MLKDAVDRWTVSESAELYEVPRWGKGYFSVGADGHLRVHPSRDPQRSLDLKELVDRLQLQGVDLPILLRFNGILQDRLREIHDAFSLAMREQDYKGAYSCVYPIKVNQQRQVVEEIIKHSRPYGFGLEAGSKPELLAVVAMTDADTPIICNGFKDSEFIEMALMAQKMGRRVIPVVEKYTELELILKHAKKIGVRPQIGMRVKLAAKGSGRWQSSGGYRSKFGLTVSEVLHGLEHLKQQGMADCFCLLHFHLGSQITNIRLLKGALIEATRVYADLHRRGAGVKYLDVGGGLGVDYDGSQTNFESSVNYTLQEYANDVVFHIQSVCNDAEVPHPHIISESGRAVAAYHSMLVFSVLGVSGLGDGGEDVNGNGIGNGNGHAGNGQSPAALHGGADTPAPIIPAGELEQPLIDLQDTLRNMIPRNLLESYHDAQQAMDMAIQMFCSGHLPLDQRSLAESLYWAICRKISRLVDELEFTPEELEGLDRVLADTYFCNFSLFQSMPDSWAIKQLFPVMPIHRLNEEPTRHAVLGDITCDSDGKIDQFIDRRDVRRTLLLHPFDGSPYYMGAFLIGAYQEILGDLHNLFGDTNAVHVNMTEAGEIGIETIIKGDSVREVLDYVQFNGDDLLNRVQAAIETAVRENRVDYKQAGQFLKFYEESLRGYTYLEEE
jgi:arginine decarboxylase